ncbi:WD40/YVTN/BNR-like repeat-containing protein [Dokdonella ginsengisoli]|uniref:WD40/YVTN/BNR-like repeat-containing protein n=1 Tax=Dokdonella ginsengisoli TaxID=363846 RepID=A0ABV9R0C7_9GAMM
MRERITSALAWLSPWAIIGGLAYAAVFVEVDVATEPMAQPLVENRDLFFGAAAADGHLWFVGQGGAVLALDEKSQQWTRTQLQPATNLQGLAASDSGVLVAVGNGGRYWVRGGDGQWNAQTLPVGDVGNKLLDVAFFGGHFWIVGEMGALFRSDAQGAYWTRLREADDVAFNRIRPGPAGSIWIAAEFGKLLRSDDDGASWHVVELGSESLQSIAFDGGIGVVVGNRGRAYRSGDAGASWQPIATFTTEHLYDVLARADGWLATGDRGAVFAAARDAEGWKPLAPQGLGKGYHVRLLASGTGDVLVGRGVGVLGADGGYQPWPARALR